MVVLAIIVAAFACAWFVQAALVACNLSQIRDLATLAPPDPPSWPRVSTIIPARNEATDISASLASRLGDGYPDLELVVVDDRSDDETPQILAGFSAGDERVKVVRVDELPDGWLGKVHALDCGVREASGEWLLFSDADIELVPEFRSRSGIVDELVIKAHLVGGTVIADSVDIDTSTPSSEQTVIN